MPDFMNHRLHSIACELRDTAESNRDFAFYNIYLSVFIPALVTILGDEKSIAFGKESFDHVSIALPEERALRQ